ncbi:MAG: hypothetical protein EOP09_16170 [Proteobacteria bacterium]|nr:MAG: hypothetical protein EOP09_16170 [Pseudomonadota bacterium]
MKISYFGSTWAASCVASTGGAIYAAVVAAVISRGQISMMQIAIVTLVSIVISLPVLLAGSATIGWWTTKILAQRVITNRLLVFAITGMLMGLIAVALMLVFGVLFLGFSLREVPRTMNEIIHGGLVASIPIFCLTLAGVVTGAHVIRSERDAINRPK